MSDSEKDLHPGPEACAGTHPSELHRESRGAMAATNSVPVGHKAWPLPSVSTKAAAAPRLHRPGVPVCGRGQRSLRSSSLSRRPAGSLWVVPLVIKSIQVGRKGKETAGGAGGQC